MNDRFKFRVWWEKEHRYRVDAKIHPIEKFFRKEFVIEQCTGLKDKNGNLIYEGDIVRCSDGNIYNICWSDSAMIMIAVNTTTKIGDAIYKLKCYDDLEIIGNIHEQPEQKE